MCLLRSFHGKTISKSKQEKRLRKMQEELDAKRAATAEGSNAAFSRIGGQQMAGTPYTVLSGKLQPGQSSDPASGFASVTHQVLPPSGRQSVAYLCVAKRALCMIRLSGRVRRWLPLRFREVKRRGLAAA